MSIEHALNFLKRAVSDAQLQEQIAAINTIDEPERERALVTVSQGVGFDCTPEELRQALKIVDAELPDEELRAVTGGVLADTASQPLLQPPTTTFDSQMESRRFSTISNILKIKHDVTMNSITNYK